MILWSNTLRAITGWSIARSISLVNVIERERMLCLSLLVLGLGQGVAPRMGRDRSSELTYNTLMEKFSVFLSHITVESRLADLIKRHLVHDFIGLVEVFESSDRLSIPAGAKWLTEVMEGLQRANLHLILCNQDSTSRPCLQFEAGAAHLRQIPIVPLCHGGLTCAQLPVPLSEYEGIQASDPEGLVALYRAIATALVSSIPEIDFCAFAD